MYLNMDKTIVGILLCLFFVKRFDKEGFIKQDIHLALKLLMGLVLVLLPLSLLMGYVRFDFKVPNIIWMLNNLFFVCFAEEVLFRGFVQRGLSFAFPQTDWGRKSTVAVTALAFGLTHFLGGPVYVFLSAVAGLFYGYAYLRTNKIEYSIMIHFSLNLIHFTFFSYPALSP